ncbi:hypothetical protein Mgra_00009596, partial [Meloidogyne graminicola]
MPLDKRRNALSFNNNQFKLTNEQITNEFSENLQINKINISMDYEQSEEEFPKNSNYIFPANIEQINNSPPYLLIPTESILNLQKSLQNNKIINNNNSFSFPFCYQNNLITTTTSTTTTTNSSSSLVLNELKNYLFNYNYLINNQKQNFNYYYIQEKDIIEAILTSPQALVISGLLPSNILENNQFWDHWLCRLAISLNSLQWQKFWHQYASIFGFKYLPTHLLHFFENFALNENIKNNFLNNNSLIYGQHSTTNNKNNNFNILPSSIEIKLKSKINEQICGIICKFNN